MKISATFKTNGSGYWSSAERAVKVYKMEIDNFYSEFDTDDEEFDVKDLDQGELRVYFTLKTWDIEKHGLIYTDDRFLRELRSFLDKQGLPGKDVDYSEQGMQGDNYVSLDIGKKFLRAWAKKYKVDLKAELAKQERELARRLAR